MVYVYVSLYDRDVARIFFRGGFRLCESEGTRQISTPFSPLVVAYLPRKGLLDCKTVEFFCERGRPSLVERKVWSECINDEGEWRFQPSDTSKNECLRSRGLQKGRSREPQEPHGYSLEQ